VADDLDIEIRPARARDYDAIVALWRDAGLDARCEGRDTREAFIRQLDVFPSTYLVAEHRSAIVGVVFGTHDHRKGWINRLAVHPSMQRRGIARRLLDECEQGLRAAGIEIFAALVEEGNERSVRTFDRSGYLRDIPVHYFHRRLRPEV